MKRILRGGVIFNLAAVLLAVLLSRIDRTDLIIWFDVVRADLMIAGVWVLWAVFWVLGNVLFLRKVRHQKRSQAIADAHAVPIAIAQENAITPERLREEFAHFHKLRPALREQIETAVAQLDSMNRKQLKLRRIFERNRVSSLYEVESTIGNAEQALCRNMAKLINRIILWDPLEWNKPGKKQIYDDHRDYIQKLLEQGEEILSRCDILLAETVGYLDEKDTDIDSGKLHLDVMTQTIQSLRSISSEEL